MLTVSYGVLVGDQTLPINFISLMIVLRKSGRKRPIRDDARSGSPVGGPTLSLDKAARDLAGQRHALLDVHTQGQNVAPGRGACERVAVEVSWCRASGRHRATGLSGKLPVSSTIERSLLYV